MSLKQQREAIQRLQKLKKICLNPINKKLKPNKFFYKIK
jgi:hypothetical protein